METRTERYTRYRERIKSMSEMEFPKTVESKASFSAMEAELSGSAISINASGTPSYGLSTSPYRLYLRRQRVYVVLKVILAILVASGLAVWAVFLFGRK